MALFRRTLRLVRRGGNTIEITRRLAVAVVVLTLATPLSAQSIHPDLKGSQIVSLDVASIERNAQNGTPFELPVGEKG